MPTLSSPGTWLSHLISGGIGALIVLFIMNQNPAWLNRQSTATAVGPIPAQNQNNGSTTTSSSPVVATVQNVTPAVVSIIITKDVPVIERYFSNEPNAVVPFDQFFGSDPFLGSPFGFQQPQYRQKGTEKQEIGGGSGFLVSADGLIVTNKHVVEDATADYTVFTNDGQKHETKVIARDPVSDIAVLKIDGTNLPFLQFGDSDHIQVGETAIAIGNALGEFRNTVSVGVISGLSRSIVAGDFSGSAEQLDKVIQTDAAINPGNSGGPLLNLAGQVVGMNVAVAQGSQSIGFALPANAVKTVVESVQQTGKISRPFLGVRYIPITPEIKEQNKLAVDYGVLIIRDPQQANQLAVIPGSPADKAGLQEGDIIIEADGKRLDDTTSLSSVIQTKKVGETVTLKVIQKGQTKDVTITLSEMQ